MEEFIYNQLKSFKNLTMSLIDAVNFGDTDFVIEKGILYAGKLIPESEKALIAVEDERPNKKATKKKIKDKKPTRKEEKATEKKKKKRKRNLKNKGKRHGRKKDK